jgi:hypothetical protein
MKPQQTVGGLYGARRATEEETADAAKGDAAAEKK